MKDVSTLAPDGWYARRELAHGYARIHDEPERSCTDDFELTVQPLACTLLHEGGEASRWSRRACELGDKGACLLEALDDPARLRELCADGAANACAWSQESVRTGIDRGEPNEPLLRAQLACVIQGEPVACAAAAKGLAAHGLHESAEAFDRTACAWGYTPSCEPDPLRALADEAPPSILGDSMLKPGTMEPLPGRPRIFGWTGRPLGY